MPVRQKPPLIFLCGAVTAAMPGGTPEIETRHAAKSIWAMAHGFVTLSLADGDEADARVAYSVKALLAGAPKS